MARGEDGIPGGAWDVLDANADGYAVRLQAKIAKEFGLQAIRRSLKGILIAGSATQGGGRGGAS